MWNQVTGDNIKTWEACPDSKAMVTSITLIAGRLWCGRTDGAISVFNEHTGEQVFELQVHKHAIGMVAVAFGYVWTTSVTDDVAVLVPDGANTKVQRRFPLPPPPRPKSRVLIKASREHGRPS